MRPAPHAIRHHAHSAIPLLFVLPVAFASFGISRSFGDFTYIFCVAVLIFLSVRFATGFRRYGATILAAFLFSALSFTLLTETVLFARETVFDLAESYGQSALSGFVIYALGAPAVLVSMIAAVLVRLVCETRGGV